MLGEVVRAKRMVLGWKQQTLADRTGLAQSYISMIETGEVSDVSMATLRRLAQVLAIPVEDLVKAGTPVRDEVETDPLAGELPADVVAKLREWQPHLTQDDWDDLVRDAIRRARKNREIAELRAQREAQPQPEAPPPPEQTRPRTFVDSAVGYHVPDDDPATDQLAG